MLISSATTRALDDVAARQRDVIRTFTPERGSALDPLSTAPPAGSYFITRDAHGTLLFTKDGAFTLREGVLLDASGLPVQGYRDAKSALSSLQVDPVDGVLGFADTARIEPDGTVTYERTTIDPRSGARDRQRVPIGRIALARFAPGTKLQFADESHAGAMPGIAPHVGMPGDGSFDRLAPFTREQNAVDMDRGLQRLQEAYLALDAIRAADVAQRSVEKSAMDLLK